MKPSVVFFGTPDFAVQTLDALHEAGYPITLVVSRPDRPRGRGMRSQSPPVVTRAQQLGFTVSQPTTAHDPTLIQQLKATKAPVAVLFAYGAILPNTLVEIFPKGILNIHPSLLPRWRGPAPIPWTILSGDQETGCTIMRLDAGMDTGPIIAQKTISVPQHATAGSLTNTLAVEGTELLMGSLSPYLSGTLAALPQPSRGATTARMLRKDDGKVNWSDPAKVVEQRHRAFTPWPGTFTELNDERVRILEAHTHSKENLAAAAPAGTITSGDDGSFLVHCGKNTLLHLVRVQLPGRSAMSGAAFLRGKPGWIGARFS